MRLSLLLSLGVASALAAVHCSPSTGLPIAPPPDAAADADVPADAGPVSDVPLAPTGKVDLLFVVDGSASMGTKAALVARDVRVLLDRLANPRCVDASGAPSGASQAGACAAGAPEFAPVRDIHVGIVSASLGSFGGDTCGAGPRHNDKAHLLTAGPTGVVAGLQPAGFLAYGATPSGSPVPAIADAATLADRTAELVRGVGETGCGFEAQLEAGYRFLVQPDPWESVVVDPGTQRAQYKGLDAELLTQRRAFLRPDSLVAVVLVTDEDDSSADPLSVGGQGWAFMSNSFLGSTVFRPDGRTTTAPKATSACLVDPSSPDCTSCALSRSCDPSEASCQRIKSDPACASGLYYGAADESLNVRFHRMKERYGVDPQYPIARYVSGLSEPTVPSRDDEHDATGAYVGTRGCTNPLFAAALPESGAHCKLERGPRHPRQVVFGVLAGVPAGLVQSGTQLKQVLSADDWRGIVGASPDTYDLTGIDPHMWASVSARPGLAPPSGKRGDNGPDAVHGREWDTKKDDLQFACRFELPTPMECRTPNCYCPPASMGADKNPPLCAASADTSAGVQTHAAAYPGHRPLRVAKGLGASGVVGSVCALSPRETSPDDPGAGYRPFFHGLVDRMSAGLSK
jgi:hypothetical protein